MSSKRTDLLSRFDIPNLDSRIVGASRKDVIVELETCHAVGVTFQNPDRTASKLPVISDLQKVLDQSPAEPQRSSNERLPPIYPYKRPSSCVSWAPASVLAVPECIDAFRWACHLASRRSS